MKQPRTTPADDPDDQSLRSPPPATAKTPPADKSDNQSMRPPAQTKATKNPQFRANAPEENSTQTQ